MPRRREGEQPKIKVTPSEAIMLSCPECGKPVATGRGRLYCSPACQRQSRSRRRAEQQTPFVPEDALPPKFEQPVRQVIDSITRTRQVHNYETRHRRVASANDDLAELLVRAKAQRDLNNDTGCALILRDAVEVAQSVLEQMVRLSGVAEGLAA